MQITEADYPLIRRLEAASFRSFPSTVTHFNGTWAIRLTRCHPAKRLNSINPLDPGDTWDIEQRIKQETRRFDKFGRRLVFRLTPLAGQKLVSHLDLHDWQSFDETTVMQLDLRRVNLDDAMDQLPFRDTKRWVDAFYNIENANSPSSSGKTASGLVEVIESIPAQTGLFLHETIASGPACALRAVSDSNWVGLFDIVTNTKNQRQGLATHLIFSALQWAHNNGATSAWLQVLTANHRAISLYKSIGFKPVYRYIYIAAQNKMAAMV